MWTSGFAWKRGFAFFLFILAIDVSQTSADLVTVTIQDSEFHATGALNSPYGWKPVLPTEADVDIQQSDFALQGIDLVTGQIGLINSLVSENPNEIMSVPFYSLIHMEVAFESSSFSSVEEINWSIRYRINSTSNLIAPSMIVVAEPEDTEYTFANLLNVNRFEVTGNEFVEWTGSASASDFLKVAPRGIVEGETMANFGFDQDLHWGMTVGFSMEGIEEEDRGSAFELVLDSYEVNIIAQAVPEPSSALLLLGTVIPFALRRRRPV